MKPEVGDLWEVKASMGPKRCIVIELSYRSQHGNCFEVLWLDPNDYGRKERIHEWHFQQMAWSKIA